MKNLNLKIAIIKSGIPQYEVARKARIRYLRISGFIGGYLNPKIDELERLAEVLNCDVKDIS